jgi:hypothetical protein
VLGLLYLSGVYRTNRLNLEDRWRSDGLGIDIFRRVMNEFAQIQIIFNSAFLKTKNREVFITFFGFQEKSTILSYVHESEEPGTILLPVRAILLGLNG